jgi:hypothetical protein
MSNAARFRLEDVLNQAEKTVRFTTLNEQFSVNFHSGNMMLYFIAIKGRKSCIFTNMCDRM